MKADRKWWNDGLLEREVGPLYVDGDSLVPCHVTCVSCGRYREWYPDFLNGCEGLSSDEAIEIWKTDYSRCAPCTLTRFLSDVYPPMTSLKERVRSVRVWQAWDFEGM